MLTQWITFIVLVQGVAIEPRIPADLMGRCVAIPVAAGATARMQTLRLAGTSTDLTTIAVTNALGQTMESQVAVACRKEEQ